MFCHHVCGIDCASDLLDPELLVFLLLCSHKYFVSICLIAPLPLRRASPHGAAASVQIRTWASCLNSRIVLANPMASLARRAMRWYTDSALLSDTTSCVDDQVAKVCSPTRKHPPDIERLVFGQPAASASESPSISTMLSSCCNGNSHTVHGVTSRYRPTRFRRARPARVAFLIARLHSLHANAMSGLSDATYASLADTL